MMREACSVKWGERFASAQRPCGAARFGGLKLTLQVASLEPARSNFSVGWASAHRLNGATPTAWRDAQ